LRADHRKRIVDLIESRIDRSQAKEKFKKEHIQHIVRQGIDKLRITEPSVKLLYKEISLEYARDEEFIALYARSFPPMKSVDGLKFLLPPGRVRGKWMCSFALTASVARNQ
jgi:hypothetical protein